MNWRRMEWILFKLFDFRRWCKDWYSENASNAFLAIALEHMKAKRIFGSNRLPLKFCATACRPINRAVEEKLVLVVWQNRDNTLEVLIQWEGQGIKETTWEPKISIQFPTFSPTRTRWSICVGIYNPWIQFYWYLVWDL